VKQLRHPPLKPDAIGYAKFCSGHMTPSFAFTMTRAMSSKRTLGALRLFLVAACWLLDRG
jgi:hypothetical protein